MKLVSIVALCLSFCFLTGCGERKAQVNKPQAYDYQQLAFSYPGNWEVTEDETTEDLRYAFVETPGDAITILQIYEPDFSLSIQEYAENFSTSAREATPYGEVSEGIFTELTSESLKETFIITVLGVEVPHERRIVRKAFSGGICFMVFQVAEEDLKKVQPGFQLIERTLSLAE